MAASWWLRWPDRLYDSRIFLTCCQLVAPLGFVAVVAGWITTEVGRQPWTVYGLLRTSASVTPTLTGLDVAISLAAYVAVYLLMYPFGIWMMMRLVRKGVMDQPVAAAGGERAARAAFRRGRHRRR